MLIKNNPMKKWSFISFILLTMACLAGNPEDNDPAGDFMTSGQYDQAARWLTDVYSKTPGDSIALRIGEAYTMDKQYNNALQWFNKAGDIETADGSRFLLLKGDALLGTGQYDKAKDTYKLYAGLTRKEDLVIERLSALEQLARAADLSEGWAIENLPCNTPSDEWSVTNFRSKELIISNQAAPAEADKSAWFDFFTLEREYDKWLAPKPLMKPEDETHDIIGITFSRDGNSVYFVQVETIALPPAKGKGKGSKSEGGMAEIKFRLNSATTLGNKFYNIQPMPFAQDGFRIKDPCIDATGTLLYFSSDMPGGYGGFDIYVSHNINGRWILPENLGSSVNSPYDDLSPYVRQDKTDPSLYFSSDRPFGFGGLDLYKTIQEKNKWVKAEILSPPLNSSGDEYSIMFDQNSRSGYLTSNRSGGKGGFDVYRFMPYSLTIAAEVKDTLRQPVGFASVSLNNSEAMTDNTGRAFFTAQPNRDYMMRVNCKDYDPANKEVTTKGHVLFDTISVPVTLLKTFHTKISVQQFVDFHVYTRDAAGKNIANPLFTIINLQNSRVRNVEGDENGLLEQVLLPDCDYRLILVEDGYTFSEKISTRGINPGSLLAYSLVLKNGNYSFTKK